MIASPVAYNDTKFKELLLHVAEQSVTDPRFGKTKLNKILFYIDFIAYQNLGAPVTGATYQHRPKGPVPKEIAAARAQLFASGDAMPTFEPYMGFTQERLFAKRPADMTMFSDSEKQIIATVVRALWEKSATAASNTSHREPGWRLADEREDIPYESVFIDTREMTPSDVRRGQELWSELSVPA